MYFLYTFFPLRGFDFSTTPSRVDTLIALLCVIALTIALHPAIHFDIAYKENKNFWWAKTLEKEESLEYNKKNFFQKWFLLGTKGKVCLITRILYFIKNVLLFVVVGLAVTHIIIFSHTVSVVFRCMMVEPIALGAVAVIIHFVDKKIKKNRTNKKP